MSSMTVSFGDDYETTIGLFSENSYVEYYIWATDGLDNEGAATNGGSYYSFTIAMNDDSGPLINSITH